MFSASILESPLLKVIANFVCGDIEIEEFMEHRKSLLQSEVTRKQYHLDLLRFNIFLEGKGIYEVSQITNTLILEYIQNHMSKFKNAKEL